MGASYVITKWHIPSNVWSTRRKEGDSGAAGSVVQHRPHGRRVVPYGDAKPVSNPPGNGSDFDTDCDGDARFDSDDWIQHAYHDPYLSKK